MKEYPFRPVSRSFGFDRGQPVDRYFIDQFLNDYQSVIQGKVLEIGDNAYTKKYAKQLESSDVLDIQPWKGVSIVGDLETGENLPAEQFDCFILTQVIHILYDLKASANHAMKVLKPGGKLLVTVPGLSQSCKTKDYGDFWRFTSMSLRRLFEDMEVVDEVTVQSFGNLAIAQAFLEGRAVHEVNPGAFSFHDPHYEVLIGAVVRKGGTAT
ncbi:class I SAM-dependent methyltransferase [Pseudalkalibacillus sp. Hm43]|uniref:class I SAM-dependent methyltransferase n=1 Tax=Pseudalkalibacillus sp. Hm43 TaxID=3450742 RepID=UPI003F423BB2